MQKSWAWWRNDKEVSVAGLELAKQSGKRYQKITRPHCVWPGGPLLELKLSRSLNEMGNC